MLDDAPLGLVFAQSNRHDRSVHVQFAALVFEQQVAGWHEAEAAREEARVGQVDRGLAAATNPEAPVRAKQSTGHVLGRQTFGGVETVNLPQVGHIDRALVILKTRGVLDAPRGGVVVEVVGASADRVLV